MADGRQSTLFPRPYKFYGLFAGNALHIEPEHFDMLQATSYFSVRVNSRRVLVAQQAQSAFYLPAVADYLNISGHNHAPEIGCEFLWADIIAGYRAERAPRAIAYEVNLAAAAALWKYICLSPSQA